MRNNLEKELDAYINEFIRDIKFETRSGFVSVRKEKIPRLEFPIFSLSDETFCRNKYLNELII